MLKVFLSKNFIFRQILQGTALRNSHSCSSIQEPAGEATMHPDHPTWNTVRTKRPGCSQKGVEANSGVGPQNISVSTSPSENLGPGVTK